MIEQPHGREEAESVALRLLRSSSLQTLIYLTSMYDLDTRLVELQHLSSLGHYDDVAKSTCNYNENTTFPNGVEFVQMSPINQNMTGSGANGAVAIDRNAVVVDDVTVRRNVLICCLRGTLSHVSTNEFHSTPTKSGWSDPTPIQSLRMPSSVIAQQLVQERDTQVKDNTKTSKNNERLNQLINEKDGSAIYTIVSELSLSNRIRTLSKYLIHLLNDNDNEQQSSSNYAIDQVSEVDEMNSDKDNIHMNLSVPYVTARVIVRYGLECLNLIVNTNPGTDDGNGDDNGDDNGNIENNNDGMKKGDGNGSSVSTVSLMLKKLALHLNDDDETDINSNWYVGTITLAQGCAHESFTLLSRNTFFLTNKMLSEMISFNFILKVTHSVMMLLCPSDTYSAFKTNGISMTYIIHRWLSQCFWNYLPFDVVLVYLSIRLKVWKKKSENNENGDVQETSCFLAALIESIVLNYIKNSAVRRPVVTLNNLLIDGPLPVNLFQNNTIWERMDYYRLQKIK